MNLFLAEINFDIFKNVILFKCSIYVLLRFTQPNMDVVSGDHYFELKIEKDKVGFELLMIMGMRWSWILAEV